MHPYERSLVTKYRGKPVGILGVSLDRSEDKLQQCIRKGDITWRCWHDGDTGDIAGEWGVLAVPTFFVLDHKGVIREEFVGAPDRDELESAIDDLLKELEEDKKKPPAGDAAGQ